MRQNIGGQSPWEDVVGYSRAVRVRQMVQVAGTTATVNGEVVCIGDAYGQTKVARHLVEIEAEAVLP